MTYIYIMGDADRVRETLEKLLFALDLDRLSEQSSQLTEAIKQLAANATKYLQARIIIAGGDEVLFQIEADTYSEDILSMMSQDFYKMSGCTMSFGVSETIEGAYLALRKAKLNRGCEHTPEMKN